MKLLPYFLALIISVLVISTDAQTAITKRINFFRHGDQLIKQQLQGVDPGRSGRQVLWDFRTVSVLNEEYRAGYYGNAEDDTLHFTNYEHDTRYRYELKNDTLWMTGYENRTTDMTYTKPEAQLRYPFQFGDTLRTSFEGSGVYCQKVDLIANGDTYTEVDGLGQLITPDRDTLRSVLRVKRTRNITEIGQDSVAIRLDTYAWYVTGIRYPVFETIKSWVVRKDSIQEHFSTSFYWTKRSRAELPPDPANEDMLNGGESIENILLNCRVSPNPVVNDISVTYELSRNANVSFRLCDVSGFVWASLPPMALQAGSQQQTISMGGLPSGGYALYIMVNDKVTKKTVIKN